MHIPKFLRFGRSHSQKLPSADSNWDGNRAYSSSPPGAHASSSRPSSRLWTLQKGNPVTAPPNDGMLGDSASQLDHASLPVTPQAILELSHLALTPGSPDSITLSPTHHSQKANLPSEHGDLLVVPQHFQAPATVSQQPLPSQRLTYSLGENSSMVYGVQSINDSRNISIDGNMNSVTYTNSVVSGPSNLMEKLLENTIPGAAFDSSTRDPPPRCHPGTRLAILERCLYFISNYRDEKKIRWVFGSAGVGKSAIMQSVAETPLSSVALRASIFFFTDGRNDGSKAIVTFAYQLAVECEPYRLFIEREIARDPSLLQKSMSVQFNKFIIEPFIHYPPLNSAGRVLIIIDGLDECDNRRTQEELLRLILNFCITHPSSPLIWIIASRPEPHITSFFTRSNVEPVCEKEEILVDSDEAREDVERFLRSELTKIQIDFSLNPRTLWPSEKDFWKLAKASGGLFVYARTVVKYVGDPDIGNPTSQLGDVLKIIDAHPLPNGSREHPMAQLDALYAQILSKVPIEAKSNMRKLFLALVIGWERQSEESGKKFIVLCNWLGISCHDAYAAIRHLYSVLKVPRHDEAHQEDLHYFHKSFIDYIYDFTRSGFSPDIKQEAQKLRAECAFRILRQADNIDFGDVDYTVYGLLIIGILARDPGARCNILLSWPVDEEIDWDDNTTRLYMYKMAMSSVVEGIRNGQQAFYNVFCIHLLATRFVSYFYCGVENMHDVVFDKSHRHELVEQGLLKHIPVTILSFLGIRWCTWLRLNRPIAPLINLSDPWNSSCTHERLGEWGEGKIQDWTTEIDMDDCGFCSERLKRQLEHWQTRFPDHQVSILFTSAGKCFVEFQFVDQEDGTKWTYWLVHDFEEEERKKLGSTV